MDVYYRMKNINMDSSRRHLFRYGSPLLYPYGNISTIMRTHYTKEKKLYRLIWERSKETIRKLPTSQNEFLKEVDRMWTMK